MRNIRRARPEHTEFRTHPELLELGKVRNVLDHSDHVVADIEGAEFNLDVSLDRHRITDILLQSLNLCQTVVAEIELLEVDEVFEAVELGDPVALDREDLEVGECAEALGVSCVRGHRNSRGGT